MDGLRYDVRRSYMKYKISIKDEIEEMQAVDQTNALIGFIHHHPDKTITLTYNGCTNDTTAKP